MVVGVRHLAARKTIPPISNIGNVYGRVDTFISEQAKQQRTFMAKTPNKCDAKTLNAQNSRQNPPSQTHARPNTPLTLLHSSLPIAFLVSTVRAADSLFSAARRKRKLRHSVVVPHVMHFTTFACVSAFIVSSCTKL
jgi:hypothetical protein